MMKTRYLAVFFFLFVFIPSASCSVSDIQITPNQPVQGDLIHLSVFADPFETVDVTINIERELDVISGNYILRVNNIEIPSTPNSFSVRVHNVLTLNIAAFGVTLSPQVTNSVGYLSVPNLPSGKRDVKISGYASPGETKVICEVSAWTQVTMDENGRYYDTYDLGDIPSGDVSAIVGGKTKTVKIYPPDTTPPVISGMNPNGEITTSDPVISASYSDFFGIRTNTVSLLVDGDDVSSQSSITENGITFQAHDLGNNTNHQVFLSVSDTNGNTATKSWTFNVKQDPLPDTTAPIISNTKPTGNIGVNSIQILASLSDNKKIDQSSVLLRLNEQDITSKAQITQNAVTCTLSNLDNSTLYSVSISVSDTAGNTASTHWSFTVQIPPINNPNPPSVIPNIPPIPSIQSPSFIILGDLILLNGSDSNDSDGIITEYVWEIDGEIHKTGVMVSHNFKTSGEHTIQLSVTDNNGHQISTSKTIYVYATQEYRIRANPGSSRTVFTGQHVAFDGSKSNSMGGKIAHYNWNIENSNKKGEKVTHIFNSSGIYNVSLTITDQRQISNTTSIQINVVSPPLTPTIREETLLTNSTFKIKSANIQTNVTITSTSETSLLLFEYPSNPFPTKRLPPVVFGHVKDISVSNPDSIMWPLYIEIKINSTYDQSVLSRLGLYWYNGTSWLLCKDTGYNASSDTVWAFMTKEETAGSPIIPAIRPSNADIVIIQLLVDPDIIQVGDSVNYTVHLENRGDLKGTYSGEIYIDDVLQNIATEVEGLTTSIIQGSIYPTNSGNFTISLDAIESSFVVIPLAADLQIISTSVSTETVYSRDPLSINVTVANLGDTRAENIVLSLYEDNHSYYHTVISRLKPQEHVELSCKITIHEPIEHNLTIHLDQLNAIPELDEDNNLDVLTFRVREKPVYTQYLSIVFLAIILVSSYIYRVQLSQYIRDYFNYR